MYIVMVIRSVLWCCWLDDRKGIWPRQQIVLQ